MIGAKVLFLRDKAVWSGLGKDNPIIEKSEFTKPSTSRNGNLNTSLEVRIVSIASSEY